MNGAPVQATHVKAEKFTPMEKCVKPTVTTLLPKRHIGVRRLVRVKVIRRQGELVRNATPTNDVTYLTITAPI